MSLIKEFRRDAATFQQYREEIMTFVHDAYM